MVKKAIDTEAKASLKPFFEIRKIDSRCLKNYRLLPKKKKDEASQEYRNKDKDKAKSHNPLSANIYQIQTQISKKDKRHGSCQKGHPATRVDTTEVAKKDKDKDKANNLSHIKYYTYKQKGHYIKKCPKK